MTSHLRSALRAVFPLCGYSQPYAKAYVLLLATNPGMDHRGTPEFMSFTAEKAVPLMEGGGYELYASRGGTFYGDTHHSTTIKMTGYRTYFHALSLTDCKIKANLEKSRLRGCNMQGSHLQVTSDKVHISHCDFAGATLKGQNMRFGDEAGRFYNSTFEGATLSISVNGVGSSSVDRCSFVGADMRRARFNGVVMRRCDFRGADLRGAQLDTLVLCSFKGAQVQGMKITGFAFPWTLARLWLGGADFSEFAPFKGLMDWMYLTDRPLEDFY